MNHLVMSYKRTLMTKFFVYFSISDEIIFCPGICLRLIKRIRSEIYENKFIIIRLAWVNSCSNVRLNFKVHSNQNRNEIHMVLV